METTRRPHPPTSRSRRRSRPLAAAGLLLLTACSGSHASPERPRVGDVELHNTGAPDAQADFLAGLAALHSFWYEEARDLFQRAQEIDPGFALAYWGEAMTHYHPIWRSTSPAAGRAALDALEAEAGDRLERYGTAVEQALVEAARRLFEDGDGAFSEALAEARAEFPDNTEIAVFYALSLQGRATGPGRRGAEDRRLIAESAELLEALFERHPRHPGVLHYLIHAVDDPANAHRGLEAADLYSEIAPDSSHALHMPTHIYLQVGDWDGVVEMNRRAWEASERWVERKDLPLWRKDYHALSWLHYGLLQQGNFTGAEGVLETLRANGGGLAGSEARYKARHLIETEDWDFELPDSDRDEVRFARAFAAANRGRLEEARAGLESFSRAAGTDDILGHELEGLIAFVTGRSERAVASLARAAELEMGTRIPTGPPDLLKPALELQGEVLLELGACDEARRAFERSLERMPNRRLSVRGERRAAACSTG